MLWLDDMYAKATERALRKPRLYRARAPAPRGWRD